MWNWLLDQYWNYSDHVREAQEYGQQQGWLDDEGVPLGRAEAGQYNAFAHAYLSAMISYETGRSDAWLLGNLRETNTTAEYYYGNGGDYRLDTFRDLFNNRIGRDIGAYAYQQNLSQGDLIALLEDALTRQERGIGGGLILSVDDPRIPEIINGKGIFGLFANNQGGFNGWPIDFEFAGDPWKPHQLSEVEREQLRHRQLDALAEFIDQAERATSDYDRNLAHNNLQDAIADYKRFYGGDPAAMADLQSYADRLGVLWQGSPVPGGGPSELAVPMIAFGGPYTGADPTVRRSGSKGDYARYMAGPPATDPATAGLRAGGVAGQPSAAQYLSRSYQAALPYMAGQTFGGQPAGPISLFGPQPAGTSMPRNPFAAVPPAYPATASPYSMRVPQLDPAMPLGQSATVTGIGILAKEMVKPQRGPLDVDDDDAVRAADAPLSSGGRDKGTATPADEERAARSGAADSGSGTDSSIITKPSSQLNTLPPEGLTTEEWMRQRNELLAKKKAVAEAEAAAAAKSTSSTAVKK